MRVWVLGLWMIAGCYRPQASGTVARQASPLEAHDAVDLAEPEPGPPTALVAMAPATARPSLFVAGCNTACIDCGLGSYRTFVIGTDARGRQLFPSPDPPVPGYSCSATVAVGERVTLRAHSPEGLVIDAWSGFSAADHCPCAGTRAQVCTFIVTPEIASRHERIYCGAAWKQKPAAQIGH